ncbi:hypothetical protein CHY_0824 [Carboxydothermus hydrogenoformans Z-2901]|uniref:Uncharacterized protein n=1 Tax=Carboxydothermus hydrogenoformans (strain ATCC BAA-161 / DSM 6008 / Z-2901) TaxID=246194 RepID=Q3ADV5_CARHZ|nr:hypothetical protein CHY_0824 [Carboxydothermus hydrogenoformans Z-2901]
MAMLTAMIIMLEKVKDKAKASLKARVGDKQPTAFVTPKRY